jgi:hypothetical protein
MSTLNVANISDGADTVETGYIINGSAKAYGKVDQRTTSSLYSSSLNISSLTDLGTATSQLHFTSNLNGSSYSACGGTDFGVTNFSQFQTYNLITSSFTAVNSPDAQSSYADGLVSFVIMGDLA